MTHPLPLYYSRSAVVADWKCPRARYWGYEYAGRGLTPDTASLALSLGIILHDGLAAIAHKVNIDAIADAAVQQVKGLFTSEPDSEQFACEQSALVEGLLRGYSKHIWPNFCSTYEVVSIEQEVVYHHDGLVFMAKPDLLVRDHEGNLWYFEYKSTSSVKDQWINSWSTAVQLHSSVRAVEEALGEKVTGVIVQGLYKGYSGYGKQNSIFCYGNHKAGNPPFSESVWSYEWKAGLKKSPIWERDGGVKRWVAEMPAELLSQQFPQVPPVFLNDHLIDRFFRQRAEREVGIRQSRNRILDDISDQERLELMDCAFPQHFEECTPGWGYACDFKKLCHGSIDDPLKAGFTVRVSHHLMEQEALDAIV